MSLNTENAGFGGWKAQWITKPTTHHKSWSRYSVEVKITVETRGANVLFGVRDESDYIGCALDAEERTVSLYAVEGGVRREWGKAPAPELEGQPANVAVAIVQSADTVRVYLNGRQALTASDIELRPGTVGFKTDAGQTAVYQELRVYAEDGRSLYVNRFYEPTAIQFTASSANSPGIGLRLDENTVSVCESPVSVDSPLFRRTFTIPAGVVKAVAHVYAAGWYELRINGRKVDNRVLAPANTPYDRIMLYDTYDVTSALVLGGNAIGLWLGNGYNLNYSRWGWKWKRDKAAILQLDIELADGTSQQIITDESWLTTDSPIMTNDIYDGETFDGRREQLGWDTYDFQGEGWLPAIAAVPPEGELQPNAQPPVRKFDPLEPVRILRPRDGVLVYDFGQNIAGWVDVRVEGAAGSKLTLKYSELIDATGNIDPWTNRRANATDVYILTGRGVENYEPRFTYHGFQYVEVSGGLEPIEMWAVPIHADVREIGRFASSDAMLNRIQRNIRWSLLNNLVSIPTDCCQRDERTPCLMDSATVEEAAIHNFDMRLYYRKWLGDIADSLGNPDWSGDKVTLPWYLYWYYGDTEVLQDNYESMKSYIDHLLAKWPGGIVEEGFGDWCAPNEDGWENYFREVAIVNTALYYRQAAVVSEAAGVLGQAEDRRHYAALAAAIKRAFHARFHQGGGVYGSGSQTAQVMPLAFGIVPEDNVMQAVSSLVAAITAKDNHLDTGIYGTRYLLDVLADHGHINLAYTLLTREDYPSFGWQIGQGATTLWEQWSFKGGMHSHDHAMFGGIGTSFYTRLGGIQPLAPGYAKIGIRPYVPNGLEWVEACVDTAKGRIVSAWRKEGDRLHFDIEIPAKTTAVVALPDGTASFARVEHIVGPGRHQFTV
ncbi:family 78 glycoside hydrolase catalytic domain [Paenibacillus sp. HJGM_3]|uniref:family 78 glycoside hydrolase catalytic domain n=1 Tax=Paenibacillus sp. HJGM_3 TaxID=3379816 RepID=UPI00385D8975